MTLGFTGTHFGCSIHQIRRLPFLLYRLQPTIVHHGACVGADREFHYWSVNTIDRPRPQVIMWPSNTEQEHWALQGKDPMDIVQPIKPPLERNHNVVDSTEGLLTCPRTMQEEQRSGTWATVRHARKRKRPIYLLWPDGTITTENL